MATFWAFWVRNPLFAVAALAFLAGGFDIVPWGVALVLATVAVLMGDAAWHLSRKAHARVARKLEPPPAVASQPPAYERFSDYPAERENAA